MAVARTLIARGLVPYRELLLVQAVELLLWPKSERCPLFTLKMADVQISSSLSPCSPLAELNEMVGYGGGTVELNDCLS